ncbi:Sps4 protein [Maudiozyma humilis]|uniref:Sps4 protein n=1 Tax=Maudiozyma humilis TaxID=51915 RepID=A0AAV5S4B8_MAUHU|nr:Sps4 protein [Kazachstania humilis]
MNQIPVVTADITEMTSEQPVGPVPPMTETNIVNNVVDQPENVATTGGIAYKSTCKDKINGNCDGSCKNIHHFKTLQHLNSIRLYAEAKEKVDKISVVRIFKANTRPLCEHITRSSPFVKMQFLTDFVDRTTLSTIELTEKCLPSIKTVSTSDVVEAIKYPIVTPIKLTKDVKDATVDFVTYFAYRPYHNQVLKFRGFYNKKIINTKNRPLLRGVFDPIVGPLNDSAEAKVKAMFPDRKYHQKDTFCCETSRTLSLAYNFMEGSKYRTLHLLGKTMMLPFTTAQAFDTALNKHLDMQSDMGLRSTVKATNGALFELKKEMYQSLKRKTISRKITSTVDQQAENSEGVQEGSDVHILPITLPEESQTGSAQADAALLTTDITPEAMVSNPEVSNVTFVPTY